MSRSDINKLIERGRKAGLSTQELYTALSARPPEAAEQGPGVSDGNGYVAEYNEQGQRVYHPANDKDAAQ